MIRAPYIYPGVCNLRERVHVLSVSYAYKSPPEDRLERDDSGGFTAAFAEVLLRLSRGFIVLLLQQHETVSCHF